MTLTVGLRSSCHEQQDVYDMHPEQSTEKLFS